MEQSRVAKGKIFSASRDVAQDIMERAAAAFPEANLSPIMFAREGDYYFYINFLGEGPEVRGWRDLLPTAAQRSTLFNLGLGIPATRGEASDLLSKVLSKKESSRS